MRAFLDGWLSLSIFGFMRRLLLSYGHLHGQFMGEYVRETGCGGTAGGLSLSSNLGGLLCLHELRLGVEEA